MRSARPAEGRWSLTRRMAVTFSLITSALLLLHALWSGWFVVGDMRDDLKRFLQHESEELALALSRTDGSPEAVAAVLADIARVSEDPATAFRVRRGERGPVLAQDGEPRLLQAVPEPLPPGASWRRHLLDRAVASEVVVAPGHDMIAEVLLDAGPALHAVRGYLAGAGVALLASVALAALAGWFTAARGLSGLRKVVAGARDVDVLAPRTRLDLAGAPSEVADVGAAFEAMLQRIDEGLSAMRAFTAGLAHELRSPLQNLVGETEVALLSERSPASYRQVLASNLEDLAELSDAVDNLVAYCRASEPRGGAARREVFDLAEEAGLRLQREQRSAARAGVSLRLATSGDTRLLADREGCLRVVRNLVGNAITWSPRGGVVTVGVHGQDGHVLLAVDDEGPGVPSEVRGRMFEPFVSRALAGRRAGYGLGLAICRAVVLEHGGTLVHDASRADGTRLLATFPRGEVTPGAPRASERAPHGEPAAP